MKKEVKRTSFGKVALARARSQSNTDGRGLGRACATAWIFHFGLLGAARHDLHLSPCRPPACARPHTLSLTHTHTIHSEARHALCTAREGGGVGGFQETNETGIPAR